MSKKTFTLTPQQTEELIDKLFDHILTATTVSKWKWRQQLTLIFNQYQLPLSIRRFLATRCRKEYDQLKREAFADQYL